jgi:uncharacterized protein YciW
MSVATVTTNDVVNRILGINGDGKIAALRRQKPELAEQLQTYYLALFEPEAASAEAFALTDRYLIAVRVAAHTGSAAVIDWYATLAKQAGVPAETLARIQNTATPWTDSSKLAAAVRHTDLLTKSPADAQASDLQALKDGGFTPAGILSLSQVIAFVNYQLRLIAGLRAFGENA